MNFLFYGLVFVYNITVVDNHMHRDYNMDTSIMDH